MTGKAIIVEQLSKTFGGGRSLFGKPAPAIHAVRSVSLELQEGETLAVVGESGSGKSTLARMLVGLERPSSGTMTIGGKDAAALAAEGSRAFGRTIQYVFQDPVASLNPRKTIAQILDVPLRLLRRADGTSRKTRMRELLDAVQMPANALERYPHEFSGGQAQRIAIARALAADARILVLDEPVSALDVSVQAQVLLLLDDLRRQFGLSYLFISHDLAVVESISDRVAVMYLGELVEIGEAQSLFANPQHDYTRDLIASAPRLTHRTTAPGQ
jgi:peptide/nickel transport system ATP-binding protein